MESIYRIEVYPKIHDTRAAIKNNKIADLNFAVKSVKLAQVYSINKNLSYTELSKITSSLINPLTSTFIIRSPYLKHTIIKTKFNWVIEVGFLPGVTDNAGKTVKEIIEDLLGIKFKVNENVYTSDLIFLTGNFKKKDIIKISENLYNPLVQRVYIKGYEEYKKTNGMDFIIPKVNIPHHDQENIIDLDISDKKLEELGKIGITNNDGSTRGPLALNFPNMKIIQTYFKKLGRKPTDIELESLAQTWSEHCKHTIFADKIDNINEGLFRGFIKKATEKIRKIKGKKDLCVSVFSDNSGAISFDKNYLITHKIETHNTPSSLDPFGGSITGIVGVNRDTIGFGLGAKPIANFYGFCLADPRIDKPIYKGKMSTQKLLSSRRIMDGVIEGVNAGGNQSGIPTPSGFIYFDERYRGKPLVFVGTVGLIPKEINNKKSYEKRALPGDYIVMIGGRVGKDGIHGATFSSEPLSDGSPVTAVQIGDPITQKKFSDVIINETRGLLLYNSITDNGAGGLSCSVSEMAKESGGFVVDIEKIPLKYPGLTPWEIWISESQERMTLAVSPHKWQKLQNLMKRRDVEATIIGKFTNSGKAIVKNYGKVIMDIDMEFLHNGLYKRHLKTVQQKIYAKKYDISLPSDLTKWVSDILKRLNIASYEFITQQYDHIVQGNLVLAPLQGKGRVNADACVIRPIFGSRKGVVLTQALYPNLTELNSYNMAASCIDAAIRQAIVVGGDPKSIALLDNFCWCDSLNPVRLGELKAALQGCYDYSTTFGAPFISGKDSMFNDFKGYDVNGKSIKISIPPTLLISSIGIVQDITRVVSLDAKFPGDLVYIMGETFDELGGSEFLKMYYEQYKEKSTSPSVPKVDAKKNRKLYEAYHRAVSKNIIVSSQSVGRGGLVVALLKTAIAGMLGIEIYLKNIKNSVSQDLSLLFSESQGRVIVTVNPRNRRLFEKIMQGNSISQIGVVSKNDTIMIKGLKGQTIVQTNVDYALSIYRQTFHNY